MSDKFSYLTLEHELVQTYGHIHVSTPGAEKVDDIIIEQTPTMTKKISFYSNDVIVYFELTATKNICRSNRPFIKVSDGEYSL